MSGCDKYCSIFPSVTLIQSSNGPCIYINNRHICGEKPPIYEAIQVKEWRVSAFKILGAVRDEHRADAASRSEL